MWLYPFEHEAVPITKNEDFPGMLVFGGAAPAIVWVRVGNTRPRALIEWFEPLIDQIVELIEAGNGLIQLR